MYPKLETQEGAAHPLNAQSDADVSIATASDLSAVVKILELGDEYFWTPERLVPFEHWAGHIPFVFWLMKVAKPRRFVELGTHRGNSYCAMCQAVERLNIAAVGMAVDTWQGDVHMHREEGLLEELSAFHNPRYGSFSTLHQATFDEARVYFSDDSVDLLHIDGTHTYESVRHDFDLWLPTLSDRGIVLFHDIGVRHSNFGVWRVWEELSAQYPSFTFTHSHGLGVLAVGRHQPAPIRALLQIAGQERESTLVRNIFSVRGDGIVDRLVRSQLVVSNEKKDADVKEGAKEIATLTEKLDAATHHARIIEEDNTALRRRLVNSQEQLKTSAAALDDMGRRVASVDSAYHQTLSSLHAIQLSTIWRATAPLRGMLTRFPAVARFGRRSMKAVWWTVTGQLPTRLRARRTALKALTTPLNTAPAALTPNTQALAHHPFRIIPRYIDPADTNRDSLVSISGRIAVHLHVFYFDLLDEFIVRLGSIPFSFDLFVSIPDTASAAQAAQAERALNEGLPRAEQIIVKPVPNRGRDIAPLIAEFGLELLNYDIVGHFHTKRSLHNAELAGWLNTILDLLLGPTGNLGGQVSTIFGMLENDAKIVCPEGPLLIPRESTGWAGNHAIASDVLDKYTNISIDDYPVVEFPEGTMFWARSAALKKLLSLPLSYCDFPSEPIEADGSLAHALERLVFILAQDSNGAVVRLHKGNSTSDHRFFEEAQDFSKRLVHTDIKVLSYYLPQFHPTPENDEWHGKGFTEWTKVRAANPLFSGHYQQHIPHPSFGYYHLDHADVLRRQATDMKRVGVHGQIFYHYWFTGKLILEQPAQILLANPDIEMPFCFCWANENWTRRWDGSEDQVLLKQNYSVEDARSFIRYLIPFFKDNRYIKVEGRPVVFIYRPTLFPSMRIYLDVWAEECQEAGLPPPYMVATLAAGTTDPRDFGMDAGVERPLYDWTNGRVEDITSKVDAYVPLKGRVFSYEDMKNFYAAEEPEIRFTCFRSLVPNWDNTARYGDRAHVLHGSTPGLFQDWLELLIAQAKRTLPQDRQFIVVNAWNEWAEGAHLEADTRYGYAYLNAIGRALANEPYGGPGRTSFHALAVANAAVGAQGRGSLMMVTHRWGGGTERHVNDMIRALAREGVVVFLTRVSKEDANWVVVERADDTSRTELGGFAVDAGPDDYCRLLTRLNVKHMHVHHLAGFPEKTADWIQHACTMADIQYDVTLHDYMAVCPRIVMVTALNKYCGEPPLSQCEACISQLGSPFGKPSVAEWRGRYARLLNHARSCFTPTHDVANRLTRYFPSATFVVRQHPEPRRNDMRLRATQLKLASGAASEGAAPTLLNKRQVVVIGHIIGHKGLNIIHACARYAKSIEAPIHFTILGTTDQDSDFDQLDNVTILGRYNPSEFLDIIERRSPDIAFLPSSCPETYSYTLSEAVVAGIYPVVFDLGAMGERVRSLGWGEVLPATWMDHPNAVVKALLDVIPTSPPQAAYELALGVAYPDFLHDYYDFEWPVSSVEGPANQGARHVPVSDAQMKEVRFSAPGREAALYVTYSPDGSVRPHVQRAVSAMVNVGISVYLILATDLPRLTIRFGELHDAAGMFIRQNAGYDFAAWAHVLKQHPEFKNVDILYLVNDSVFGPLDSKNFSDAILRVRDGTAQVYGMTENFEQGWHLQSFFLAIKQPALCSAAFKAFLDSVVSLVDKQAVIKNYELSFASAMVRAGFKAEALFSLPSERNMTLYHWQELIEQGFPFVKVQAARDEIAGVRRDEVWKALQSAGISLDDLKAIAGEQPAGT